MKRPTVRWHGAKFRMAPWIVGLMPKHHVYVEPFGGSAAVLMHKPRSTGEVYNDLDVGVVTLFRVLRDPELSLELQRRCELTPFAREELEWAYATPTDVVDLAHKMLIKSFMGFGSDSASRGCRTGFRSRASTQRATPASAWAGWPDNVPAFTERLRGVTIENCDAIELVGRFDFANTLHYLDPPYVHSTRSSLAGRSKKTHGYVHEMTDDQHAELAERARSLKGMVMVSGYHSPLYDRLYAGWRYLERAVMAEGAKPRTEVLWFSPSCEDRAPQLFERTSGAVISGHDLLEPQGGAPDLQRGRRRHPASAPGAKG